MSSAIVPDANTSPASTPGPRRSLPLPANRWVRAALIIVGGVLVMSILRQISGANDIDSSGAIGAALLAAVPIGLAGLGGLWCERAGIVNIGLEGMMILGTWAAAYGTLTSGSIWVGMLSGMLGGVAGAALHAIATVTFGVDHIVSGVAINIIGLGAAKYLADRTFRNMDGGGPTNSPGLPDVPSITIPGVSSGLSSIEKHHWFLISDIAGILGGLTTNVSVLTILAILLVLGSVWALWRTSFGLRLRSCGENPEAAETLGVNVLRYKFVAVLISGALAGLGGTFLAMVAGNGYVEGQTGGRGYIGLAAMIFGNWMPLALAAGALLFGYTDAIQLRQGGPTVHALLLLIGVVLLAIGLWQLIRNRRAVQGIIALLVGAGVLYVYLSADQVPNQFTQMTPYVTTLLVMAFASQHLRMPAADGKVYRKGQAS